MEVPDKFIIEMLEPSLHNIRVWGNQLGNKTAEYNLQIDLEDIEIFKRMLRFFCSEEEINKVFDPHKKLINDLRAQLNMEIFK